MIFIELTNTNNKIVKEFFQQNGCSGKIAGGEKAKEEVLAQIRSNFDKIQQFAAEKLALARKVYAYVDANLTKISQKMKVIEAEEGF